MPDITITAEKQIKLLTHGKYCESDIIIVPGGVVELFAAIGVTYPVGSVLTCTDGTTTLTANTTTGRWLFAIPYAATWIVTTTDGSQTATQTVEITTEGQVLSVSLSYLVPVAYQAVEYLESTGTQFIDTGISPSTMSASAKVVLDITPESGYFCGATTSSYTNAFFASGIGDNKAVMYWGGNYKTGVPITLPETLPITVELTGIKGSGASMKINDITVMDVVSTQTSFTSNTLYLFGNNTGSLSRAYSGKIHRTKNWIDDVLIADFVPCYRKVDSVAGMWDRVREQFHTNDGTGTFIVGADI